MSLQDADKGEDLCLLLSSAVFLSLVQAIRIDGNDPRMEPTISPEPNFMFILPRVLPAFDTGQLGGTLA